MAHGVINQLLEREGLQHRLTKASQFWGEDDFSGLFVSELLELFDVDSMTKTDRQKGCHALWRFRRPFSLAHFTNTLNMEVDASHKFPVLASFVTMVSPGSSSPFTPEHERLCLLLFPTAAT